MLHSFLSDKILQPLFWHTKRVPVGRYYKEFSKVLSLSVEEQKEIRRLKLENILMYAVKNVPAYKYLDKDVNDCIRENQTREALKLFPVVKKSEYISRLEEYKSLAIEKYIVNTSGGSTGEPVKVLQDVNFKAAALASTKIMYEMAGRENSSLILKLWGAERDLIKSKYGVKHRLSDYIMNLITINAFLMTPERMRDYVASINRYKPVCIEGYADSLFALANFIEEEELDVHSPISVISSAGTLYNEIRDKITSVFNTHVYDRYGCREVGNIAMQFDPTRPNLKVFEDTIYLEVLDQSNSDVDEKEEGRIVLTSLYNTAMPIIRYEIGDLGVWGGGEYQVLEAVTGRMSYSLRTLDGGYVSPTFFCHFFGVMMNSSNIFKFQVRQKKLDHLQINLVISEGFNIQEWVRQNNIEVLLKKIMGPSCNIEFLSVPEIPLTATGKHNYIISEL